MAGGSLKARLTGRPAEDATNVELYFDLLFVFAVTRLTSLFRHDSATTGLDQALLVLGLLCWMYNGCVCLTNAVRPGSLAPKLVLFRAMAAFLGLAACFFPASLADCDRLPGSGQRSVPAGLAFSLGVTDRAMIFGIVLLSPGIEGVIPRPGQGAAGQSRGCWPAELRSS